MENESIRLPRFIVPLAIAGFFLSNLAFTRSVRRQMINRDGSCRAEGLHIGILEASHIDHDRNNPLYNSLENGLILCTKHHLEQHIREVGNNGLTQEQNDWAIDAISKRLQQFIQKSK